jgi:hypothetical protein
VTDRLRKAIADFTTLFPLPFRPIVHLKVMTLIEALLEELKS